MSLNTVRFPKKENIDFVKTLRSRVNQYFKTNNISKYGDWRMVVKTFVMILLYFVPYAFIVSGALASAWAVTGAWALMGVGAAGIGLSIMHDANHGAYSKNEKVNRSLGYLMNLIGGNSTIWKIQHNVLHHSFTNVDGLDEDISGNKLLRFSPHAHWRAIHKYQFVYAWFFYSLMSLFWLTAKEFLQIYKYKNEGLTKPFGKFGRLLTGLIVWKVVYLIYMLAIPLIFSPVAWWITLSGFIGMHLVTGFILSIIFQPAHVMPDNQYPVADHAGNMENEWAVHQVLTTTNFAPKSRLFSWFVGGLNFQIEHHLFPNICHVHYKKISRIVQETAHEFNLPYHSQKTFLKALILHGSMLKQLGAQRESAVVPVR